MHAVTIWDLERHGDHHLLAFDLRDILELFESALDGTTWRCLGDWERDWELIGAEANVALREVVETQRWLSGSELLKISRVIQQTINGDFVGYRNGGFWVRIRAIDSTEFAVITSDTRVISAVRNRFRDVRDSPDDARWYGV